MLPIITIQLDGFAELQRSLDRLERTISSGSVTPIGRRLAIEGKRIVTKLTPKRRNRRIGGQSRGEPFHKGWDKAERVMTNTSYTAVIRNKAVGTREGRYALASVEFGAPGHDIFPRGPWKLRWRRSAGHSEFLGRTQLGAPSRFDPLEDGISVFERRAKRAPRRSGWVATDHVDHPGMSAFHMVSDTRVQLGRVTDSLLRQKQKEIARIFGPLTIGVR